jgi:hypothetical protein
MGARIAMELRPITAIVTSIAATKRMVIWAWSFFIGAFTGNMDNCQLESYYVRRGFRAILASAKKPFTEDNKGN